MAFIAECDNFFRTKCDGLLLQGAKAKFINKHDSFIAKC